MTSARDLSAAFAATTGTWSGSNGFRMMPADPFSTHPWTATLTLAAGGSLVAFAGDWGWRIALAAGDGLTMRMENVVPASVAGEADTGPYTVMLAELGRST